MQCDTLLGPLVQPGGNYMDYLMLGLERIQTVFPIVMGQSTTAFEKINLSCILSHCLFLRHIL